MRHWYQNSINPEKKPCKMTRSRSKGKSNKALSRFESKAMINLQFPPLLRTHDILVRIRGSMPLTNGSGSCYFVIALQQDANKKLIFLNSFLLITFWRYIFIIFKDKKKKESENSWNQDFSYNFCLVIEVSGSAGSGSVPPTNESGSRGPRNISATLVSRIYIKSADLMAGAPGLAAGDPERHRGLEQYLNEEVFGIPHRTDTVVERPASLAPGRLLQVEGARHQLDLAEARELFHGALSHSVYIPSKGRWHSYTERNRKYFILTAWRAWQWALKKIFVQYC